jgi:hypothetical protein
MYLDIQGGAPPEATGSRRSSIAASDVTPRSAGDSASNPFLIYDPSHLDQIISTTAKDLDVEHATESLKNGAQLARDANTGIEYLKNLGRLSALDEREIQAETRRGFWQQSHALKGTMFVCDSSSLL